MATKMCYMAIPLPPVASCFSDADSGCIRVSRTSESNQQRINTKKKEENNREREKEGEEE